MVFPFIIWFYGSAVVIIIRGWGCGFGNSREDIVARSGTYPSGPSRLFRKASEK
jgi:hypothetical protein